MKGILKRSAFRLAALSVSLAACGGGSSNQAETTPASTAEPVAPAPATPPPAAAAPAHLKFAEMTISEGTRPILKIHADGKTEVAGQGGVWSEGPAVAPDGTITFKAQQVARIEADGTIKNLRTGQLIPVTVAPDLLTAQISGNEVKFQMSAEGIIAVPGAPPEKHLKVDGATDPETRRTALALVGAIFISGRTQQQSTQPAQPSGQPAQPAQPNPQPQPTPPAPKP